uniref:FH2 domain-containing protein n=1 Tax=Caenorhabditis tropicalis TaxID=1561998 RepID=A0A1I7U474_9PELO
MGKSKSKSNSRSISKLRRLFSGGPKVSESKEDLGSQPVSPAPSAGNSLTGNPKSKPKRKPSRDDGTGPKSQEDPASATPKSPSDDKAKGSKAKKAKKDEEQEASVFEEVQGPAAPVRTGTHGIKNKMRWKIDVEGADCLTDQKMPEVLEKLGKLRKKWRTKRCKVLKANEKPGGATEDEDEKEPNKSEDLIMTSARILQLVKLETLITKEVSEPDQEILRSYCRSGDQEEKAEQLIEKLVLAMLHAVVAKNEFVRQVGIPGELRMFAVDEKKAKLPMMALLMARKDLFYVSWSKPNRDVENMLDGTWAGMTVKKGPSAGPIRSARLGG